MCLCFFFFFKQKTAYEIDSDWSSDVCSSDLMLYDHAHGADFASEGLEQVRPMFTLLDKSQIDRYEHRTSAPLAPLDFRSYSKHLNPRLRRYGFELKHLLR